MEKIIHLLTLAFGEHLQRVYKYISVQNKNHAKEDSILNANLDIKEGCAISAIEMPLMEIPMVKLEHILAMYVQKLVFNFYKL